MKRIALFVALALAGQPAFADHRQSTRLLDVSYEDNPYRCTRTEVRIVEEFGVVNTYRYTSSLPGCHQQHTRYYSGNQPEYHPQSASPSAPMSRAKCRNQALIGTAAGAGIAAAVSKPDAYKWSIPTGAVAGYLLGRHDCL